MVIDSGVHVVESGAGHFVGICVASCPAMSLPTAAVRDAANLFDIHMD